MYCVTGGRRNKHRSTEDYVHSMYRAGYTLELGGNHHYHHAQQYIHNPNPAPGGWAHTWGHFWCCCCFQWEGGCWKKWWWVAKRPLAVKVRCTTLTAASTLLWWCLCRRRSTVLFDSILSSRGITVVIPFLPILRPPGAQGEMEMCPFLYDTQYYTLIL